VAYPRLPALPKGASLAKNNARVRCAIPRPNGEPMQSLPASRSFFLIVAVIAAALIWSLNKTGGTKDRSEEPGYPVGATTEILRAGNSKPRSTASQSSRVARGRIAQRKDPVESLIRGAIFFNDSLRGHRQPSALQNCAHRRMRSGARDMRLAFKWCHSGGRPRVPRFGLHGARSAVGSARLSALFARSPFALVFLTFRELMASPGTRMPFSTTAFKVLDFYPQALAGTTNPTSTS